MALLILAIIFTAAVLWPHYEKRIRSGDWVALCGFLALSIFVGCLILLMGFSAGQLLGGEIVKVARLL